MVIFLNDYSFFPRGLPFSHFWNLILTISVNKMIISGLTSLPSCKIVSPLLTAASLASPLRAWRTALAAMVEYWT